MKNSTINIIAGTGIFLFIIGLIFAQVGQIPECTRKAYSLGDISWVAFVFTSIFLIGAIVGYSVYQNIHEEK
jgi:hypothetical protein